MLTEEQRRLLVGIDGDLRREGIAIPFRVFHAIGRFAKYYAVAINARSSLAEAIQGWYTDHYGDRLRGITLLGKLPVQLRDDVHILLLKPHVEMSTRGKVLPGLAWSFDAGTELFASLAPSLDFHDREFA